MTILAGQNINIQDVARRSGVSAATVSRVLNHPAMVRPQLCARVERAVAELGYVPHGAARTLASNRTRTMGAIVPTVDSALFAKVVDCVQQTIQESGYTLLLASSNYQPGREAAEVRAFIERGIDGLILVGATRSEDVYELLRSKRIPFVNICTFVADAPWPSVGWDNHEAAARIAQYLVDVGHRRFSIIAGITKGNDRAAARMAGFRDALAASGITVGPEMVIEMPYTIPDARIAMARLLRLVQRPSAVLCGNDILAFGALQECLWSGVRVPQDMSITGFDDIEMAAHCYPAITTLRVPADEVGRCAAQILLAAQRDPHHANSVRLELELILRGTTGPPRAGVDEVVLPSHSRRSRKKTRSAKDASEGNRRR